MNYYSQCQQDKVLNENFFKNNKNGIFIDVGAHDGIKLSNSYFYEKYLNWTGICFEPLPEVFDKLKNNRKCLCINKAAYNENITLEFMQNTGYTEMLSGIVNTYNEDHKARIKREIAYHGGTSKILQVETVKLADIIEEHNYKTIDYLSIDTEGSEYQVLQGIDFNKVHINIIDVEVNYSGNSDHLNIIKLLEDNNFMLWKKCSWDEIYINKSLKYSWEA